MEHEMEFDRAGMLLMIVSECAKHSPMFTSISEVAVAELKDMNAAARDWLAEKAKAEAEAKAEIDRIEAARVAKEQAAADEANTASTGRTAQANVIPATELPPSDPAPVTRRA